jgi:predicted nuclease of predicted toxin-antitoxin system
MKIKLDENIPDELSELLQQIGHDVHTVAFEGLAGRDDAVIFAAASGENRLLITQDLDFPICGSSNQERTLESP